MDAPFLGPGGEPSPCARRRRDCFLIPRQEPPPPLRGGRFTAAIGDLPVVWLRIGRNRRESAEKRVTPNQCDTSVLPGSLWQARIARHRETLRGFGTGSPPPLFLPTSRVGGTRLENGDVYIFVSFESRQRTIRRIARFRAGQVKMAYPASIRARERLHLRIKVMSEDAAIGHVPWETPRDPGETGSPEHVAFSSLTPRPRRRCENGRREFRSPTAKTRIDDSISASCRMLIRF